eukprot:357510-Chlamydomonas_euryale.AAC.3
MHAQRQRSLGTGSQWPPHHSRAGAQQRGWTQSADGTYGGGANSGFRTPIPRVAGRRRQIACADPCFGRSRCRACEAARVPSACAGRFCVDRRGGGEGVLRAEARSRTPT